MGVFKRRIGLGWYGVAAGAVFGIAFLTYGVTVGYGVSVGVWPKFSRSNDTEDGRGAQLSAPHATRTDSAVFPGKSWSSPSTANGPVASYGIPPRSYVPAPTEGPVSTSRGAPTTNAAGSSSGLQSGGRDPAATGAGAVTPGQHWTRGGATASAPGGASSAVGGRSSSTRAGNSSGSEGQQPAPPTGNAPNSVDRSARSSVASPTTSQAPSSSGVPGAPSGQSLSVPTPETSSVPGPTTAFNGPSSRIVETASTGDGIPGADVILPGTFNPGHSPGTAFFGSLELVDTSHLIMEIAGRNAYEYDHIIVEGLLTFSGTLEVRLLSGFTPLGGDRFDFFDWGSATGHFDHILLPALAQHLTWDISDLYVTGEMFVRNGTDDVSGLSATAQLFALDSPRADVQVSWSATFLLLTTGLVAIALFRRR